MKTTYISRSKVYLGNANTRGPLRVAAAIGSWRSNLDEALGDDKKPAKASTPIQMISI